VTVEYKNDMTVEGGTEVKTVIVVGKAEMSVETIVVEIIEPGRTEVRYRVEIETDGGRVGSVISPNDTATVFTWPTASVKLRYDMPPLILTMLNLYLAITLKGGMKEMIA
jgi:hypothetical protein